MEPQELQEIIAVNNTRIDFYRMLASYYFTELTQRQIEDIAQSGLLQMQTDDALMHEGIQDIGHFLRLLNSGTRQTLAVDYAHTFLAAGNYETFVATPYESVFTSESGLLMQEARDEVYKYYCEQQMQPEATLQTPEDHLSFEFEFMALLIERTNEALEAGDLPCALNLLKTTHSFHHEHQLNWIDDFCSMAFSTAQTRFYQGLAKITKSFVHLDTEVIDDELDMVEEAFAVETSEELA